jgi:hypothetical protein
MLFIWSREAAAAEEVRIRGLETRSRGGKKDRPIASIGASRQDLLLNFFLLVVIFIAISLIFFFFFFRLFCFDFGFFVVFVGAAAASHFWVVSEEKRAKKLKDLQKGKSQDQRESMKTTIRDRRSNSQRRSKQIVRRKKLFLLV